MVQIHNMVLYSDISGKEYSDLTVNAAPSCEDISHMIRLCPDYSVLGTRLLDEVTTLINEHAPENIRTGGILSFFLLFMFDRLSES